MSQLATQSLLEAVLERILADRARLTRFLNTLSYLEHLGSRKILQSTSYASEQYLRHATEETRHAYFFRRAASRFSDGEPIDDYSDANLMAPSGAKGYFQRLDATVRRCVNDWKLLPTAESCYLLVTLLIEQRAEKLYPFLQRQLDTHEVDLSLRTVIGEEDRHLEEMRSGAALIQRLTPSMVQELESEEDRLFDRFVRALADSL